MKLPRKKSGPKPRPPEELKQFLGIRIAPEAIRFVRANADGNVSAYVERLILRAAKRARKK